MKQILAFAKNKIAWLESSSVNEPWGTFLKNLPNLPFSSRMFRAVPLKNPRVWGRGWFAVCLFIVACQRGWVSNEPLGQRQDTGPGILWSVHRWTRKEQTAHLIRLFTKAGWAWHVTIYNLTYHFLIEVILSRWFSIGLAAECRFLPSAVHLTH